MRWATFLVLALILGIFFWGWGGSSINQDFPYLYKKVIGQTLNMEINGVRIRAEIARTSTQKTKGLADRDVLSSDQGMLFVYSQALIPSFWMKGMRIPLDFIWIKDDIVVDITENVPMANGQNFPTYSPKEPVNRILEVNAGFCLQHGIKVGQKVSYSKEIKQGS